MRKQDYLVNLIKSLSPNEHRYFKLLSNLQGGDKEYMRLFEALESCTEYDTGALTQTMNITPGVLAEKKHYLSQALLFALRNFQTETPYNIGRRSVEDVWILHQRRQFDYALDVADKALARAWQMEQFEVINQLLRVKLLCLQALEMDHEVYPLLADYKKAESAAIELFEINLIAARINRIETSRPTLGSKKIADKAIIKKDVKQLQSLRAQVEWFDVMFRHNIALNNIKKVQQVSRLEVEHYGKHPQIKMINPIAYGVAFSRLANAEFFAQNYESALIAINKYVLALNDSSLNIAKTRLNSLKYYGDLFKANLLRRLERYTEAVVLSKKCYDNRVQRPLSEQYSATHDYAIALFNTGNVDEAAIKLEELLQIKDDVRLDLQQITRAMMVIVQLDQGNYLLIPYFIKSVKAWMKRRKCAWPEMEILFSHANAIAKAPELQRGEQWLKLQNTIAADKLNELDHETNLKIWIEGKVAKTSSRRKK